jgi:phage gp46-like protein
VVVTDVLLRQTNDGGDITAENGLLAMSEGLETAAYLSLFGGNLDDEGDAASSRLQWWGNLDEVEPARVYRSETQALLRALPAVPSNLRRVEQAAGRDLAWFISSGIARSVDASASIPAVNRIRLTVNIVTAAGVALPQFVFG